MTPNKFAEILERHILSEPSMGDEVDVASVERLSEEILIHLETGESFAIIVKRY
jgi:hypothetical protein